MGEPNAIRCFFCSGTGRRDDGEECRRCSATGSVFWADGRAYPYTPEGEKQARAAQRDMQEVGG